jgi:hypothetical protein
VPIPSGSAWKAEGVRTLDELLTEHRSAPFPESVAKGEDYGEVDAVMIGADIYGWGLRAKGGSLSAEDRERLRAARDGLSRSLTAFPDDARPYYEMVLAIANAALA